MDNDLTNFYATAAQVIPALLILLVIESRFMTAIRGYRGLNDAPDEIASAIELTERAARRILSGVMGGRLVLWTLRFYYVRPTRLSNSILVIGTVVWPLLGEALAFGSLIHAPAGNGKLLVVGAISLALGVLVTEALIALLWLSFSSTGGAAAGFSPTSPGSPGTSAGPNTMQ